MLCTSESASDSAMAFGTGVGVAWLPVSQTLTYQNLLFCRVPINSILGFIIRTYKKVGYGSLRKTYFAKEVLWGTQGGLNNSEGLVGSY